MKIQFYGANWCKDCQKVREYLGSHKIDYDYIDIDKDEAAANKVKEINNGNASIPTLIFPDKSILSEPTIDELNIKFQKSDDQKANYTDLIIVGGGPAGLTAAIYTTREGVKTKIMEKKAVGGQAATTDKIENYPGFPEGISGFKLASAMAAQAQEFGTEILTGIEVKNIVDEGKYKKLETSEGEFHARAVILGLGTEYRKLNVPGETENIGRGVHFCATCDGPFFKGKEVIVVGGGNSAMQEAIFLTRFVEKVTIIAWDTKLTGSDFLIQKTTTDPKINVNYNLQTTKLERADKKMRLYATERSSNEEKMFEADGIFVFIGLVPNTGFLKETTIELDPRGFIITDKTLQTNIPGVYAAGDCRSGSTLQIASAVGEGAVSALMVREYLKEH